VHRSNYYWERSRIHAGQTGYGRLWIVSWRRRAANTVCDASLKFISDPLDAAPQSVHCNPQTISYRLAVIDLCALFVLVILQNQLATLDR
jgi:hypothetical protein